MRPLLQIGTVLIAAAMSAVVTTSARERNPSGQKSVFRYEYPAYLAFRGEMNRLTRTDRRAWVESVDSAAGFMKKFISEELEIDPQMAVRANTYAAEHSEKLALLHLNGEARRIWGHPEVLERYFPGHWVYQPGAVVAEKLSAEDTEVRVADVTPFLGPGYPDQRATPKRYLPLQVLLVRLGPDGERLWYESEYAEIVSVDRQQGLLVLKRGLYGTRPLDFAAGKAYVAPLAGGVWGGQVMWFYNLSSACPQDRRGRRANECYADEIVSWFGPDGRLSAFDGIAFDVNYFDVSERGAQWDVDNNGTADGGWIAGRNVWEEGDLAFLARPRTPSGTVPDARLAGPGEGTADPLRRRLRTGCLPLREGVGGAAHLLRLRSGRAGEWRGGLGSRRNGVLRRRGDPGDPPDAPRPEPSGRRCSLCGAGPA